MTETIPREAPQASPNTPPVAPKRYGYRVRDQFGQHFDDPWDWLRDGDNPEVRAHLEAENAWADAVTEPTREAAARLVEEVKASTALTDVTVPIRDDEAVVDAGYGFAWADDSASFIYMGVDDAWRACDVWLHRVGTPREADELLLVEPDEGFEMGFAPSGFPGHVVIHSSSSTAGRAWLWLPAHPSVRPLPLMSVRPRTLVTVDSAGDRLFIVHTGLTQEGSLAQAMLPAGGSHEALAQLGMTSSPAYSRQALADRTPGTPLPEDEPTPLTPFESWEPLRSPGPGERITDVEAHADYVALSLRSGSLTQIDVWDRREEKPTWRRVEVDAPVRTITTVPTPWTDPLRVEFQSQTVPPTVAEVSLPNPAPASSPENPHSEDTSEIAALGVRTLRTREAPGWDPAEYVEERVWVLARDGATRIPVTLIHHRDARPDRAILAGVPFVDALTTILDPTLPLTVGEWEEWGNPLTSRAVFDAMSRYTPYENVPDGALLPAIMATTSVNDTRVEFVEPTKWVQRLREATGQVPSTDEAGAGQRCNCCDSEAGEASASGEAGHGLVAARDPLERPIILRTEMVAGHAGPSGREGRWAARCEEFAFALGQVGVSL